MEVYCFVLCCMLFTTVATFTIPDAIPEYGKNDSLLQTAESQGCECVNGKCVTDNRGNKKCVCKPRHAIQDNFTCQLCDCGTLGNCLFILRPKSREGFTYEKKCVCNAGSAEKDGICINCHCGVNSLCEFEGEEKKCYCMDGYSEKDGICTKCDCGFYGECKFEAGHKICKCDEGSLEIDGYCKECDCGERGKCTFREGEKFCECDAGYSENYGICEECDCGDSGIYCNFNYGKKICECKEKYSDNYGKCEECDCGEKSLECRFSNDEKKCKCDYGYVQKGSMCEVGCSDYRQCHHGGYCKGGFCDCLTGTDGEFCEVIQECESLCPERRDINCSYDVDQKKAFCKCQDYKLRFDPERRICRNTCDESKQCKNGGTCIKSGFEHFCRCLKGTEGDFCEYIPECSFKDCGTDADCKYDVTVEKAVCICKNAYFSFDTSDMRCKKTCDYDSVCENGGKCSGQFCDCLEGTKGDSCEVVPECEIKDCGYDAKCLYSLDIKSAICQCDDKYNTFDEADRKCKKTCDYDSGCENGGKCSGQFCDCLEGTKGDSCEVVPECEIKDCGYDAKCVYRPERKSAICQCEKGYNAFDEADRKCKKTCDYDSVCENGGKCSGQFCDCLEGTKGDSCEVVPECEIKDCGYDAKCVYSPEKKSSICQCEKEYNAFDEVDRKCKMSCYNLNCLNGGKCTLKGSAHFCECFPGTKGDMCEIVEECTEGGKKCKGGYCHFDAEKKKAVCGCSDEKKRYDSLNEECKFPCCQNATCKNGGQCTLRGEYSFCECKLGTSGTFCETIDDCERGVCGYTDDVECLYDMIKKAGICKCKNSAHLFDPVSKTCKACDCGKNTISCRYVDGKKVCSCHDGYGAENGICQKKSCTQKTCSHGKCVVIDDKEVCSCFEGYVLEGDYCKKLNCSETPCINGTCVVRHGNVEECVCQAGYTLNKDICTRGQCQQTTCYGGKCEMVDGELMCVCPPKYHLEGIGCYATICKIQRCFGGKCEVNDDNEEICTCREGYILQNDVCKKILCKKNCFGGQCQTVDGRDECICPDGFSVFEDVCREDIIIRH